ncbi:hypothetical protein Taro_043792 [Colocasia esculenta]|uniref:Uncharacterized protein n=1 Tax=Colocasia esculenta TaxID=4460 RepID=A0A843WHC8_COLES|nr:hypothetical protein [Colocasia esculenta]
MPVSGLVRAKGVKTLGFRSWLRLSVMLNVLFLPLMGLLKDPDTVSHLVVFENLLKLGQNFIYVTVFRSYIF